MQTATIIVLAQGVGAPVSAAFIWTLLDAIFKPKLRADRLDLFIGMAASASIITCWRLI